MDNIQTAPFARQRPQKPQLPQMTSPAHQDHQVPGGGDDDALPVYCRFNDIRDAGICTSWVQLARLIEKEAFHQEFRCRPIRASGPFPRSAPGSPAVPPPPPLRKSHSPLGGGSARGSRPPS